MWEILKVRKERWEIKSFVLLITPTKKVKNTRLFYVKKIQTVINSTQTYYSDILFLKFRQLNFFKCIIS